MATNGRHFCFSAFIFPACFFRKNPLSVLEIYSGTTFAFIYMR